MNQCPFCVDSHTAAASVLGADRAAKAIRSGSIGEIGVRRHSSRGSRREPYVAYVALSV